MRKNKLYNYIKIRTCYLLLLLIISSSVEYQYEYIENESIDEEEQVLGFNIMGLIAGFIKKRIHSLKNPNYWIEKIGNKLRSQLQKLSDKQANSAINTIRDCDERLNNQNKEQLIAIRKEVGLPLDIGEFCENNPDCGKKIKNDYIYLDVMIFKIPPISANRDDNWIYPSTSFSSPSLPPIHPKILLPIKKIIDF